MSLGCWITGWLGVIAFIVLCWMGANEKPDILNRPKR